MVREESLLGRRSEGKGERFSLFHVESKICHIEGAWRALSGHPSWVSAYLRPPMEASIRIWRRIPLLSEIRSEEESRNANGDLEFAEPGILKDWILLTSTRSK